MGSAATTSTTMPLPHKIHHLRTLPSPLLLCVHRSADQLPCTSACSTSAARRRSVRALHIGASCFDGTVDHPTEVEGDSGIGIGYRLPVKEIRDIVDAPPLPPLLLSPLRNKFVILKYRDLFTVEELARPEVNLAGVEIDTSGNCRARMVCYTGLVIHQLLEDGQLGSAKEVHGFPDSAQIQFVKWSLSGRHLSFGIRSDKGKDSSKFSLWVADVETCRAEPLCQLSDINLNALFCNYVWVNDWTLLVCTIPDSRGDPPKRPFAPSGPKVHSNEHKKVIKTKIHQIFLKDKYDEDLFDYYATSQLMLVSLDGKMKAFGPPSVYTSIYPSPDLKFVLLESVHRPYSHIVSYRRFPLKVELWRTHGNFVRILCDLPLAEQVPAASNSVREGKRSIYWRADQPSTLYWVETQDGGNAKVNVSRRDIIYTEPAEPVDGKPPEILLKLDLRYGGIFWCDESLAMVKEVWYKTQTTRMWVISPGAKNVAPRLLFENNSGSPMMRRTHSGYYLIACVKRGNHDRRILLSGLVMTPKGIISFLDLLDLYTGHKERIWENDNQTYYETVMALMSNQCDGDLSLSQLKILTMKESKTKNTQYCLHVWPHKKAFQVTQFPHPYPHLASLQKKMIRYRRKDGVELTATLFLPPNYHKETDGLLPCLIWCYPQEFESKDDAEKVRLSPNEFSRIGPTSPLPFLTRGFAILFDPSMPIIGEGNEKGNDRYIEQLVASAEAAVNEVVGIGVAHPDKIAVGGHSYGAFTTVNLLAHAPHLFCCGIARSGAYNRTLTPFGFQNEQRTLWEATETYLAMSPFMSANKIKKPILLIHGEQDSNSGTLTMQSERLFDALKGHGVPCRLVLLPLEGHAYAARENIMHVLWEMDRWLHNYCINSLNSNDSSKESKTGKNSQHNFVNISVAKSC